MVAKKPRVVIVGAGVAGLTAAHRLCAAGGDRFEVVVVEASARAGGRVLTSEFAAHRVEMGATWVQGIDGSPVYALAQNAGALGVGKATAGLLPYERMDGFPDRVLTVTDCGEVVDADRVARPVEELYRGMMEAARAGEAGTGRDVEEYLRRGLRAYQAARQPGGDNNKNLEEVEDALLAMHINRERTDTSADDLGDLDLAAEGEYRDFLGDHVTIPGGYSRVVDHLVAALPPGIVRFGLRLRRLHWGHQALPVCLLHFADNGTPAIAADHVILTVSLGVLKASIGKDSSTTGAIVFDPPLPQFKRDAVQRLGFGAVNKLFMEVEPDEAPGLEVAGDGQPPEEFPFLHMAFRGHVSKIPWWMRGTESICPVHAGSSVALAWFAGREAAHLETLSDDEVIRGVDATLDSFLPGPPRWRVKRIRRSGWATDPLFMGSYSYVAVGSSGEDLDRMAEPLPRGPAADDGPPPRVLFAGEATHRTHYSTTHAAYLSGVREADRLLQLYR